MAVWGIVVGAGRGDRFGEPKQFCNLAGVRVIDRACALLRSECDGVVVVLPPGVSWDGDAAVTAVPGGSTRAESVRRGLAAVPAGAEVVLVHDAARPLATAAVCDAVIGAVREGADASVPALPVRDTIKRIDGGRVVETVDRASLVAVQTPQAFRAEALRAAHAAGDDATDDAALVEAAGGTVVVVPGDPRNIKITTPDDLLVAAALLERP
ncbi:MAG TPA: 2-C-methyl-D-erythritol 4-phosphate cytidylyltransferase [Acidimicrobiia bacterium]